MSTPMVAPSPSPIAQAPSIADLLKSLESVASRSVAAREADAEVAALTQQMEAMRGKLGQEFTKRIEQIAQAQTRDRHEHETRDAELRALLGKVIEMMGGMLEYAQRAAASANRVIESAAGATIAAVEPNPVDETRLETAIASLAGLAQRLDNLEAAHDGQGEGGFTADSVDAGAIRAQVEHEMRGELHQFAARLATHIGIDPAVLLGQQPAAPSPPAAEPAEEAPESAADGIEFDTGDGFSVDDFNPGDLGLPKS